MIACIDSDVLIDYFDGVSASADELARYSALLISRITWMEVLIGASKSSLAQAREDFLRHFQMVELDAAIAREATRLRQKYRVRLPDAIVWASARSHHALLVTRNIKDFPARHPDVRVPYQIT